ncbi:hypothetical protein A4D02_13850 [Niastella koreensis]|uniref:Uncharacterized protein n=1 Tax=Niastella koreensis TaxID=354356 RepID=A0ABX3NS42_9BACT|nr:hypothetical protein [Niastella koreensis]OQP42643.1 hypothetical protein A4D02_13850 [Niastella koreensis]
MKIILSILFSLVSAFAYSQADAKFIAFDHTGEMEKGFTTVIFSNKDLKAVKKHPFLKYKTVVFFYKIDNGLFAALIEKLSNDKHVIISDEEYWGVFMASVEQKGKTIYYTNRTFDDARQTVAGILAYLRSRNDTGAFIKNFEAIAEEIEYRSK